MIAGSKEICVLRINIRKNDRIATQTARDRGSSEISCARTNEWNVPGIGNERREPTIGYRPAAVSARPSVSSVQACVRRTHRRSTDARQMLKSLPHRIRWLGRRTEDHEPSTVFLFLLSRMPAPGLTGSDRFASSFCPVPGWNLWRSNGPMTLSVSANNFFRHFFFFSASLLSRNSFDNVAHRIFGWSVSS